LALNNIQILGVIAVPIFLFMIVFALYKLRKVPIESKASEFFHIIIAAAEATVAITLVITTSLDVFFPNILQDNYASLFATAFLGAIALLWWAYASFRRQVNALQIPASGTHPATPRPTPPVTFDPVAVAREWAQRRLVRLEVQNWLDSLTTNADGSTNVSGVATDQHFMPHSYTVIVSADGTVVNERSSVN
jgi:hypothetical protein